MKTSSFRTFVPWIVLILLVYSAAFLFTEWNPQNRLMVDSAEYLAAAENLAEFGIFYAGNLSETIDPNLYSRRPPGYPVLLLGLGFNTTIIVLFQILLTFLGGFLVWSILGSIGAKPNVRKILLILYLLYPTQIIYSQMIMAEIFFEFLLLVLVFSYSKFLRENKPAWIVLGNVALSIAILSKPVMLYFWIPNAAFLIWVLAKNRCRILLICAAIPVLVNVMWSYRNYRITGYYHFSSIQMNQMSIKTTGKPIKGQGQNSFAQASQNTRQAYFRALVENWPSTLKRVVRETVFFFLDPGRFDVWEFLNKPHNIRSRDILYACGVLSFWEELRKIPLSIMVFLFLTGIVNLLITIGFINFLYQESLSFEIKWMMVLIVLYILMATIFAATGNARYRLPIEPLLIISLTPLLDRISRLKSSR